MKKIVSYLLFLLIAFSSNAQIINFPDPSFKIKLLESNIASNIAYNASNVRIKIDANGDGQIQVSEALQVYKLDVSYTVYSTNVITSLVGIENFLNLRVLDCSYSNLTSLNVSSLQYLTNLNTIENINLANLNISGLTNIISLSVRRNNLSSIDVSNLLQLQGLDVKYNSLTTLNLSGLNALTFLDCTYNYLTTLDVSGNANLVTLKCASNYFTTLSLSGNTNLKYLDCSATPNLTSVFVKNGSLDVYGSNFSNSNLNYVCCDEGNVYTINLYYPNIDNVNSYCTFVPGGTFYNITGTAQVDIDSNGCDSNDLLLPNLNLSLSNGFQNANFIGNNSGSYTIPVTAATHTLTPVLENPSYFTVLPASFTVTFPDQESPFVQNFCITPNGVHKDLDVMIIPINRARPGFDARYKIVYKNKGNQTLTGSVTFEFEDDRIDFIEANPVVSSQVFNLLSWEYTNLQPFETREIFVTLNINAPTETPAVNIGDQLNFNTTINPTIDDETLADNTSSLKQIVVGSFDPNDKTCLEGTVISPSMVGQYVHYLIRFENTGTFAAENIVVKDMIDTTKFDIASLVPMSGSHPYVTRIVNTNQVEFIFENINLPFDDANNDGYVAFKIKTLPSLVEGNTFSNSANIYFDYNYPITTNTATTAIQSLGTTDFDFGSVFSLSPVPAKNNLVITANQSISISSISIYNTLGQLVQVSTNPTETIDVSGLKTGSYFIKISSDRGNATAKFLKE